MLLYVLFPRPEKVKKPWNNNGTMQVNEWFKNKKKAKSLHIQIDDLAFNDIIKGWRHCLTSDDVWL